MKRLIITGSILCVFFSTCKKKPLVIVNPSYSIGVIVFYKAASRTASRIAFSYYVDTKQYTNNYQNNDNGWLVPGKGNYNIGDKYMIQYNIYKPETSRFLFDYPVNDSSDYKNYVLQFKTNPPK